MTLTIRTSMLAAAIFAAPLTVFAQSNNPTANLGSNKSSTATSQTADTPSSALHSGDTTATLAMPSAAAQNPHVPGATGQAVIPGSTSTVAGDRSATTTSKTNPALNGK
jgi:hypothetical protein